MSSVSIVPGASHQKLPFVHSKFKARSKFAKSFGGVSRYTKARAAGLLGTNDDVKLPRITYNAHDSRSVVSFGAAKRGSRREYPGFAGFQKNPHRRNSKNSPSTNNGGSTASRDSEDLAFSGKFSEQYRSREDILDSSRSETHSTNSTKDVLQNVDGEKEEHFPPINSLFIIDESSVEEGTVNQIPVIGDIDLQTAEVFRQKEAQRRVKEKTVFETNPFAKDFKVRLKDSRGSSGVKREKKLPNDQRTLGDIMTSKRLKELLSPRNQSAPLKFS